jgi:hypothetical protein
MLVHLYSKLSWTWKQDFLSDAIAHPSGCLCAQRYQGKYQMIVTRGIIEETGRWGHSRVQVLRRSGQPGVQQHLWDYNKWSIWFGVLTFDREIQICILFWLKTIELLIFYWRWSAGRKWWYSPI